MMTLTTDDVDVDDDDANDAERNKLDKCVCFHMLASSKTGVTSPLF